MKLPITLDYKKIAVYGWIVISAVYIAYTNIASFSHNTLPGAFQSGVQAALNDVAVQSQQCQQPFKVFAGENKVELVNVLCLNQNKDQAAKANTSGTNAQGQQQPVTGQPIPPATSVKTQAGVRK